MSLKTFHLVFITASIILAFGCGVWWTMSFFKGESGLASLVAGVLAVAGGVALIFYERYVLRKLKQQSYL
jgi:hypothetical protein